MHASCSLAAWSSSSSTITTRASVAACRCQVRMPRTCRLAAGEAKVIPNEVSGVRLVGLGASADSAAVGVAFVGRGASEGDEASHLRLESKEKFNWSRRIDGRQRSRNSLGRITRTRACFLSGESAVGQWRWRQCDTPISPSTCCGCGSGAGNVGVHISGRPLRRTRRKTASPAIGCRRFYHARAESVEPGSAQVGLAFGSGGGWFANKCNGTVGFVHGRKAIRSRKPCQDQDCRHVCMVSQDHRESNSRSTLPIAYPAFDYFEEREISKDPLVVCIGELISEFLPTVRKSPYIVPERYQSWSRHQLQPPYFAKAPGSPPGTVAVGVGRLGGNAALIGKFGDDPQGYEMHDILVRNNVETQGVVFEKSTKTQKAMVRLERGADGVLKMPCVCPSADMALSPDEVDTSLIDKAEILHTGSLSLTSEKLRSSVLYALAKAKEVKANISFDLNLPLPLWKSPRAARECIAPVWNEANYIKITDAELEFLLSDVGKGCKKVYSSSMLNEPTRWDEYRYNQADLAPLWHGNIKLLIVADGTFWLHYFTPNFHGRVGGAEDALGPDRSGCGDAFWAGMLTLLARDSTLWQSEEKVVEALKFATACSLISHTTYGIIHGLPTASAAANFARHRKVPHASQRQIPFGKVSIAESDAAALSMPSEPVASRATSLHSEADAEVDIPLLYSLEDYASRLVPSLGSQDQGQDVCAASSPSGNSNNLSSSSGSSRDSTHEFNIEVLDPLTSEDFAWLPLPSTGCLPGPQCAALCANFHTYLAFYAAPLPSPTDDEVAVGAILAYVSKVAREFRTQRHDDNNAPLLHVRIQVGQASCSALLDSGATRNFISQSFIQRASLGAQVRGKPNPMAIKLADSRTQQLLDRYIEAVPVYFAPLVCEPVTFDVLDTDFDIILGMPWLASGDHTVNFHRQTLTVGDAFGAEVLCTIPLPHPLIRCQVVTAKCFRATCGYERPNKIGLYFLRTVAAIESSPTDLSSDPRGVRLLDEFTDIFESPTGVVPNRSISHEIILEAGVVPPKGYIYRMSEEDLAVLLAQLDDLLDKGWIPPRGWGWGRGWRHNGIAPPPSAGGALHYPWQNLSDLHREGTLAGGVQQREEVQPDGLPEAVVPASAHPDTVPQFLIYQPESEILPLSDSLCDGRSDHECADDEDDDEGEQYKVEEEDDREEAVDKGDVVDYEGRGAGGGVETLPAAATLVLLLQGSHAYTGLSV
ncbi:hypothetical protein CBR_g23419 [Chara braunii]|uniref:Carbohydrate kinase PfkB domain-containing protein n=1 Tax=Chara braunii TaxID=69332 RepID=A0A388L4G6_CHABU|nr:hypothetical protein CBR_g23419 [Chara braunii]|eukprot:GBG77093.1 hypothetical protein CBR_g23419 [Chara braunii]